VLIPLVLSRVNGLWYAGEDAMLLPTVSQQEAGIWKFAWLDTLRALPLVAPRHGAIHPRPDRKQWDVKGWRGGLRDCRPVGMAVPDLLSERCIDAPKGMVQGYMR
jgi:hypothetical protein